MIFEGFPDAVGEPVVDSAFNGVKPVIGFGPHAERLADDFLGAPVEDNGQVESAPRGDLDFGHVDASDVIWPVRTGPGLVAASGAQALLESDKQVVLFHDAMDAIDAECVAWRYFRSAQIWR